MTAPVLRFAGVGRTYRSGGTTVRALHEVTLEVEAGELLAVMGPSGSGKSTLLAIAGGLDSPTAGTVWVEGTALAGLAPAALARLRRDHIGYVFQDFNLVSALTAVENVALPRELAGARARAARREALAALEEVGLADVADRFPDQLSGGQQQRVAIARALVARRRLVLADERIALRHAARHPLRTGAAVAAVGAAIAGSVGMILFSAADSTPRAIPNGPVANRTMHTGQVRLAAGDAAQLTPRDLAAVAAQLPLRALVAIRTVPLTPTLSPAATRAIGPDTPPPDAPQAVAVGGRQLIRAVTGRDPDTATMRILQRGGAVSFYPLWDHGGTVRLVNDRDNRTIRLPSALLTAPANYRDLPGLVISQDTARRLGLPVSPGGILFDTTREPTDAEWSAAETTALTAQLRQGSQSWSSPIRLLVGGPPTSETITDPMVYVLAAISALTTVLTSGVAVWMATAEMRDDLSTLTAVGADQGCAAGSRQPRPG
jgi:putative ABC transport system ATP-binding protein